MKAMDDDLSLSIREPGFKDKTRKGPLVLPSLICKRTTCLVLLCWFASPECLECCTRQQQVTTMIFLDRFEQN